MRLCKSFDLAIRFLFFDKPSLLNVPTLLLPPEDLSVARIFHPAPSFPPCFSKEKLQRAEGEGGGRGRKISRVARHKTYERRFDHKEGENYGSNGDTLSRGLEEASGANACRNYTRW